MQGTTAETPKIGTTSPGRVAALLISAEFFLTGVATSILGPLVPSIRQQFAISDEQAGRLFLAQFVGSSVGALLSQRRPRASILAGLTLVSAAFATFPYAGWTFAPLVFFFVGLGLGFAIPATNMFVASAWSNRRSESLNLINMVWGAGSLASPLVVAFIGQRHGISGVSIAIAATFAAAIALLTTNKMFRVQRSFRNDEAAALHQDVRFSAPIFLFTLVLFLYLGAETIAGAWFLAFAKEIGARDTSATAVIVCFWAALLAGRALTVPLLRYMKERVLFRTSIFLAMSGGALAFFSTSSALLAPAAFISGFGLAPLFGLNLAFLSRFAEVNGIRIPGWIFSLAGLGAAVMPWLCGALATRVGTLRPSFAVQLLALVGVLLLSRVSAVHRAGASA